MRFPRAGWACLRGQRLSAQAALGRAAWMWVCRYLPQRSEGNVNTDGVEMPRHRDIFTGGHCRGQQHPGSHHHPILLGAGDGFPTHGRAGVQLPPWIPQTGTTEMTDGARQKPPVPAAPVQKLIPPSLYFLPVSSNPSGNEQPGSIGGSARGWAGTAPLCPSRGCSHAGAGGSPTGHSAGERVKGQTPTHFCSTFRRQ